MLMIWYRGNHINANEVESCYQSEKKVCIFNLMKESQSAHVSKLIDGSSYL